MNRSAKKFVYGVFYLIIFFALGFGFYRLFLKPAPTCFDNIKNQGELQVDCGGPCAACEILGLEPIRVVDQIMFFGLTSGKTVILANILNANSDYGVSSVNYQFLIYDKFDQLQETLSGQEFLNPGESKYIYNAEARINFQSIGKIELVFLKPEWRPVREFFRPRLVLSGDLKTSVTGLIIRVSGLLRNQDPVLVSEVRIIAVLFDRFGNAVFASQTLITDLQGLGERPFVVSFPSDADLNAKVDLSATQIFFSGQ